MFQVLGFDLTSFAAFALINYIVSIFIVRKKIIMFLDPVHVGLAIYCLGLSVGAAIFQFHSIGGAILYLGLLVVYYSFLFVFAHGSLPIELDAVSQLQLRENLYFQAFAVVAGVLVLSNISVNLIGSGYTPGTDDASAKSAVSQNNRMLFLFALYYSQIMFGFAYIFWGTVAGYFCAFVFAISPIIGLLSGNKGAAAVFILQLFIISYMRVLDGRSRPRFITQVLQALAGLLVVFSFVIVTVLLVPDGNTTFTVIYRLLVQFDQIFVVMLTDFPVHKYDLSLVQWYFGSPLKAVGLYTAHYDSIGQFIYINALNYPEGYKGNLPNENIAAEFIFALGPVIGGIALAFVGGLYGLAFKYSMRRRYASPVIFLFFLLFLAGPFQFMFRGSATFIEFYIVAFSWAPFWLASKVVGTLPYLKSKKVVGLDAE